MPGQPDTIYGYSDNNLLQTQTRGAETVSYTYDDAGRPQGLAIGPQVTAAYSFDETNRLLGISYQRAGTGTGRGGPWIWQTVAGSRRPPAAGHRPRPA